MYSVSIYQINYSNKHLSNYEPEVLASQDTLTVTVAKVGPAPNLKATVQAPPEDALLGEGLGAEAEQLNSLSTFICNQVPVVGSKKVPNPFIRVTYI
jgi:hypothetical protein